MNGADWTERYPRIAEEAGRLRAPLILDAEGVADFDTLHSRIADHEAVACAFDLLVAGDDLRQRPLIERKNALRWVLRKARGGIQYVEHAEGEGAVMFAAACKLGLEGIVSKRLTSPYRSGPSKAWIKVKKIQKHRRQRGLWMGLFDIARVIFSCRALKHIETERSRRKRQLKMRATRKLSVY